VPLQPGLNQVTVNALDAAGNMGSTHRDVLLLTGQESAFEGYGAGTTGGFGQAVYVADSSAVFSNLMESIAKTAGGATIKLSGSWSYSSDIRLSDLSDVTIDGSGSDVVFQNASLIIRCSDNIIVRGIRIRNDQSGGDAIQVNSSQRVVIDHNSVSGAGDGNIDITGWSCGPSKNISVSWNIFANTWKQSLVKYGGTTQISFHHNLFYNSGNRLPLLSSDGEFDIRNNVFWQWGGSGTALQNGAKANIVGNLYEAGGVQQQSHAAIWYKDSVSEAWIENNLVPTEENDISRLPAPLATPFTTTHNPNLALELVTDQAGAWPRDSIDAALIENVRNRNFPVPPPYHD
jgi:pectate lyase